MGLNNLIANRKSFVLFLATVITLAFVFLFLVIITLSSNSLFGNKQPNSSTRNKAYINPTGNKQPNSSTRNKAYIAPGGEKIYYDPKYVTEEDIKKMIEERKKNVEF